MIRFKVVRASHLLLAISALVLAAVIAVIVLQGFSADSNTHHLLKTEAKAISAFASLPSEETRLEVEIIADIQFTPPLSDAPSILIYHTHTHEAYEQTEDMRYDALETWRTDDEQHSVVRVGAALREALAKLGYFVVHDTTDHELDDIDLAYVRSLETLESYSIPFDLVIDLHRDAYSEGLQVNLEDGNDTCAQVMLLVGDGSGYQGNDVPDYEKNLAFAQKLTHELNTSKEGIARNVTVKKGRYNQHIGEAAILLEVGHNKNTLQEALKTVPYIANAIGYILK